MSSETIETIIIDYEDRFNKLKEELDNLITKERQNDSGINKQDIVDKKKK